MTQFVRFLLISVLLTVGILSKESAEARENKRWIQNTGFGAQEYANDFEDQDVSDLTRREAHQAEKPEFPEFPQENDFDDTQKPSSDKDNFGQEPAEEQKPSDKDKDNYGQEQEQPAVEQETSGQETQTIDENANYGRKGSSYYPVTEEPRSQKVEESYTPWYKQVGHFFKKHYKNLKGTIQDTVRGRRDDYYYSE